LDSDPNCNEKKKYIGNDFATIVYNESGEDYSLNTIKVISKMISHNDCFAKV
jgi:Rap/ran-GAP